MITALRGEDTIEPAAPAPPVARARILCVDDEPGILKLLSLVLRPQYDVLTAPSGSEAMKMLKADDHVAVLLADMQMPNMNGAALLWRARQLAPHTVRVLMTAYADLASTISAINDGQIFRYVAKPFDRAALVATVDAAVQQHQLVVADHEILQQTVRGSINVLTDVLAVISPILFGRATRIKQLVSDLADRLDMPERWQVEVAAMLGPLGAVMLPAKIAEKMYYGEALSESEQVMADGVPETRDRLLANIPRFEIVREIFTICAKPQRASRSASEGKWLVERGAQMLRIATEFDALEIHSHSASLAVSTIRGRAKFYDRDILEALQDVRGIGIRKDEVREVSLAGLRAGMIFAEDIGLESGILWVARGFEVTEGFVERARNLPTGIVKEPVRVYMGREADAVEAPAAPALVVDPLTNPARPALGA